MNLADYTSSDRDKQYAQVRIIAGDYFAAMRIPLIAGRPYSEFDGPAAPGAIILNRCMAQKLFPGQNPVGRRVVADMGKPFAAEVVGIVADIREFGRSTAAPEVMYLSVAQTGWPASTLVARTSAASGTAATALREAVRQTDDAIALARLQTMQDVLSASAADPRFRAMLVSSFSGLALLLTLIGIYGTPAHTRKHWPESARCRSAGCTCGRWDPHGDMVSPWSARWRDALTLTCCASVQIVQSVAAVFVKRSLGLRALWRL